MLTIYHYQSLDEVNVFVWPGPPSQGMTKVVVYSILALLNNCKQY